MRRGFFSSRVSAMGVTTRMMRVMNVAMVVVVLLLLPGGASEAVAQGKAKPKPDSLEHGLMDAFIYCEAMRGMLRAYQETFPELAAQATQLMSQWDAATLGSERVIMERLSHYPSLVDEWDEVREKVVHDSLKEAMQRARQEPMKTAQEFIDTLRTILERGKLPEKVAAMLLCYHPDFLNAREREFDRGFTKEWSTAGKAKAHGLEVSLRHPQSWVPTESGQSRALQQWITEAGHGWDIFTVRMLHFDFVLTEDAIQEVYSEKHMRTLLGTSPRILSFSVTERKGLRMARTEFTEKVGNKSVTQRGIMFSICRGNDVVHLELTTFFKGTDAERETRMRRLMPVLERIVDSLEFGDEPRVAGNSGGGSTGSSEMPAPGQAPASAAMAPMSGLENAPPLPPGVTPELRDGLMGAHAFCQDMRGTLAEIRSTWPELALKVGQVERDWEKLYGEAERAIETRLKALLGAAWPGYLTRTLRAATKPAGLPATAEATVAQLEVVSVGMTAGVLPSPHIEMLMAWQPRFMRAPEKEFIDGLTRQWESKKEKTGLLAGLAQPLTLEYPLSWKMLSMEGSERQGSALEWVSSAGHGQERVTVEFVKLKERPAAEDLEVMFSRSFAEGLVRTRSRPREVLGFTTADLDTLPLGIIHCKETLPGSGSALRTAEARGMVFYLVHEDMRIVFDFETRMPGTPEMREERLKLLKPLFYLIVGSLRREQSTAQ